MGHLKMVIFNNLFAFSVRSEEFRPKNSFVRNLDKGREICTL